MVAKRVVLICGALLLLAMLRPPGALATSETVLGSLRITDAGATTDCGAPASIATNLFGIVTVHNPGLEKTIANHIPPFIHPIFVDVEVEVEVEVEKDSGKHKVKALGRRLDTLVALTNGSDSACLSVKLTVLNAAGTQIDTQTIALQARETKTIFLADLNLM